MVTNNSCDYQPTQYNVQTGGSAGTLNNVAPSSTTGVPLISQGASSQPTFGTATVAGGGTGNTTFTAYSVLTAGTSATGAFQNVSGVGNSGQLLSSNGAAALPTWKSFSTKNQVFTGSGTYMPTSGMVYCQVICLGGGGAGGGAASTGASQYSPGGGGGGGEYAVGIFTAATIGASQTVTIGTGGTGVSGTTGNTGGTTSLGSLITAIGGSGGATGAAGGGATAGQTGVGGTGGTGGDYRSPGFIGTYGYGYLNTFIAGGAGANSQLGSGGKGHLLAAAIGDAGTGYGSGGGGSFNTGSASALVGGAGAPGIIIIQEFIIS